MPYKCNTCDWEGYHVNETGEMNGDFNACPKCGAYCDVEKWTSTPPKEPGHYWHRWGEDAMDQSKVVIRVGEIVTTSNGIARKELTASFIGTDKQYPISELTGKWSARIEPPE